MNYPPFELLQIVQQAPAISGTSWYVFFGYGRTVVEVMVALLLACVSGHVSELPAVRTWRGYCAVTPFEPSDCTAGSLLTKERLIGLSWSVCRVRLE